MNTPAWPWVAVAVGGAAAAAILLTTKKARAGEPATPPDSLAPTTRTIPPRNLIERVFDRDPFADAVPVADDKGVMWLVAPDYIGPVGIGEAADIAKSMGGELPSPGLVDAIWRASDLKIAPPTRAQNVVSAAVFADQQARIKNLVGGRPFTLLGGTYKDVVMFGGHPQLYGWHVDVENGASAAGIPLHKPFTPGPGMIIQPLSGSVHSLGYKDYSHGVRLVKRA